LGKKQRQRLVFLRYKRHKILNKKHNIKQPIKPNKMEKFILADYWHLSIIDKTGKAYDDDLNEYRTESGVVLYIPKKYWKHFIKLEDINNR